MTTGGDAVARVLAENGVSEAYVLLGNQTVTIADGLYERDADVITARHEYNAAVMADTYGRLTGDPGIAITVAGPGGTNALTGVAQAYTAASPMILISAVLPEDEHTEALHGVDDQHFLRKAFEPATKWSTQVHDSARLPQVVARAFDIATSGRPGPVFIGVDEDILRSDVEIPPAAFDHESHETPAVASSDVADALEPVRAAEQRCLYVGKGVLRAFASDDVVEIAESLDAPVVCPRHYPDAFPNDHQLFAGTVGMSDHPAATTALANADAVLSLGVRTNSHEAAVLGDRTPDDTDIVYLDDPPYEFPASSATEVVSGDLGPALADARAALDGNAGETDAAYARAVGEESDRVSAEIDAYLEEVRSQTPVHPLVIMAELREVVDDDVLLTGDAGAAGGAWPNDAFEYREPNSFQHSRLYDSMGFPVPSGNAAKLVDPDRQVVNLIGDGGFLMCNMELATAVETETDAVTIVFNDGKYGMIWNYQRSAGHAEVATDIPTVDIATMAESFGVRGIRVTEPDEVRPALEEALEADEHVVLDVRIDPTAEYVSGRIW
ncbi:thiamine pyrophosphate-binding protein [Natrarchaeobius halalkaliphilus]|uniref:Thiamine pyrophosphate-binding protein n=1 Tax=Natrarchaeobius halalkaliphilus TaxID=1679091 RepID=A0A3N6LMF9_9EURY|nr:thiamine pyrophosphate-binding protein [Natrarchaeobius halalkaliphilus]RQG86715.1 thiamine pyrophosphate-binding protein [Natrarchaeobius halalkaliphilus]